ncbi:hypothetical protein BpHYR1_039848 [Brachionus plicatilis]|uniref:Uncharacterized protein n=1 Tax=Brachionus plicatilis TaxID=10195 RepID=A0A3M7S915_BRAPC|nr:hypothetical protein BpHYR1_039848 [Brachionus plicatilis]
MFLFTFNNSLDIAETVKDFPIPAEPIVHLVDTNLFFSISANSEVILFLYRCCDSCDFTNLS